MRRTEGFSAVELLIALVIGTVLLGSGYQLYWSIQRESTDTLRRSQASGVAYQLIRQHQKNLTSPCSAWTTTQAVPADSGLENATAQIKSSCPYNTYNPDGSLSATSHMSLLTVTVNYTSVTPQKVTRAIAIRR